MRVDSSIKELLQRDTDNGVVAGRRSEPKRLFFEDG